MNPAKTTWLITGASTGFGYEIAAQALARGDRVIATSRSTSRLHHLKAKGAALVALDHNLSFEHIQSAVKAALEIYDGVDIVVNNAAYGQTGMLEETSPEVILRQFQANFFGPLNVYRAILPHFREKRSGLLVTIGSMSAWYPLPGVNLYNSSKAALRSISLGLQSEVAGFGIKHCLIEPGYFRTELANPNANLAKLTEEDRLTDYAELNAVLDKTLDQIYGNELGDTAKGAEIIYEVLTGSGVAKGRDVPPFFPLGSDAVTAITKSAEQTLKEIKEWADISRLSDAPIGR